MRVFSTWIAGLCCVVALSAQTFRGAVTTVEIPVTVTDNTGRLILGLTRDDFEVYEDGDQQPVTQFSDKRTPVSVGVLLDISDSMRGQPIVDARTSVDRFLSDLLDPGDEAFVESRSEERRVGKECRSRWSPY